MSSIDRLNATTPANGDQFQFGPTHIRELKAFANTQLYDGFWRPASEVVTATENGQPLLDGWYGVDNFLGTYLFYGVTFSTQEALLYQLVSGVMTLMTTGTKAVIPGTVRGAARITTGLTQSWAVWTDTHLYIVGIGPTSADTQILDTHAIADIVSIVPTGTTAGQVLISTKTALSVMQFSGFPNFSAPVTTVATIPFTYSNERCVCLLGAVAGSMPARRRFGVATMRTSEIACVEWTDSTQTLEMVSPIYDISALTGTAHEIIQLLRINYTTAMRVIKRVGSNAEIKLYRVFDDIAQAGQTFPSVGFTSMVMTDNGYGYKLNANQIEKFLISYQPSLIITNPYSILS